jgi:hypothetical protein
LPLPFDLLLDLLASLFDLMLSLLGLLESPATRLLV